jgi:mannan endo-1,4-beta-mannosidase
MIASGLTATAYRNTGLQASSMYSYLVEAVAGSGTSAASNEAVAKTLAAAQQTTACHVAYNVVSDWGNGFEATLVIENAGTTTLNNWTLQWTFAGSQAVNDLWNGIATQNGATVTVVNESYNGTVVPGGSVQGVAFTATYSGTNSTPSAFTLNGVLCQ